MWSERASQSEHESLVARLRRILPAPDPDTHASTWEWALKVAPDSFAGEKIAPTPEQVATNLQEPGFSWLNGANGPRLFSRPIATISYTRALTPGEKGTARVSGPGGSAEFETCGFDLLEAALEAWKGPESAELVGYLSYDLAAELEDVGEVPEEDIGVPALYFNLYAESLEYRDGVWRARGTNAWDRHCGAMFSKGEFEALISGSAQPDTEERTKQSLHGGPVIRSKPDQAGFEGSVAKIVNEIHNGDYFQTNLCRSIEANLEAPRNASAVEWEGVGAWKLFRRMREISPARYEAFLRLSPVGLEEQAVASISPELFLKLDGPPGARIAESQPIKGTRPRGATPEQDRALLEELLASEKDRAELAMIVDVVRNDLSRVCVAGTVEVTEHAAPMTLPTVHHSYSTVRGRLREGEDAVSLLRAAFPAASISGAPKIAAIAAAYQQEKQLRGPAMGAIGWISMDGRMEMSVAIRTAFVADGVVRYYAGCGITADSDPAAEFEESSHKAAAFLRALGRD